MFGELADIYYLRIELSKGLLYVSGVHNVLELIIGRLSTRVLKLDRTEAELFVDEIIYHLTCLKKDLAIVKGDDEYTRLG